jgi:hypothetical protein
VKRYLAIPGALLLITAFVRSAVNAEWDATGLVLAAAGAAIALVTIVWNRREVVEWARDPRGVFAVTTGIAVAVFAAVVVMLNIAVWYNPWSVDLTASGRNELTDETAAILGRLDVPVVLRQFGRTPTLDPLLRSFERASRRLRVEVADPVRDRQQAQEYGITAGGQVVVVAGDKFRKLETPNEPSLVTAILQVTGGEARVVCFPTGHGERGLRDTSAGGIDALRAALDAANYAARPISLLEGDVPAECEAVIVVGPRQPYLPQEMDRLAAWADRQGRLALLLEPDPAPAFAEYLSPRGIEPGPGRILDASGAGSGLGLGATAPFALSYPDHPVTHGFALNTFYEGARPLAIAGQPYYGGTPVPIAETSPRSFATTRTDTIIGFDEGHDRRGPLALAAATSIRSGRTADEETRLVVFGDSDFIANSSRWAPNREFFLRSLAWLLGEQEATIVSVDDRENRRILLTGRTRAWMYIVNLGLLPLIPLLAGVGVYLRSRK